MGVPKQAQIRNQQHLCQTTSLMVSLSKRIRTMPLPLHLQVGQIVHRMVSKTSHGNERVARTRAAHLHAPKTILLCVPRLPQVVMRASSATLANSHTIFAPILNRNRATSKRRRIRSHRTNVCVSCPPMSATSTLQRCMNTQ